MTDLAIRDALAFMDDMGLSEREEMIAERLVKEIRARLGFLVDVGLDYLTLGRAAGTLAGGEAQRIRLATQIGSGLVGVLYILDEPSIGLHQRDNRRLLDTLLRLRDLGNTLDRRRARRGHDHRGRPHRRHRSGGGRARRRDRVRGRSEGAPRGGAVDHGRVPVGARVRSRCRGAVVSGATRNSCCRGAREHNLQNVTVAIPLGLFVCVTGVSGSGKSTLVQDVLLRALARRCPVRGCCRASTSASTGWEHIDKVIDIDQSPIGRTPRSNPATYTGVFDHIRKLFAQVPEAKIRGYQPGRFSFNVRGGRCEACAGDGRSRSRCTSCPTCT